MGLAGARAILSKIYIKRYKCLYIESDKTKYPYVHTRNWKITFLVKGFLLSYCFLTDNYHFYQFTARHFHKSSRDFTGPRFFKLAIMAWLAYSGRVKNSTANIFPIRKTRPNSLYSTRKIFQNIWGKSNPRPPKDSSKTTARISRRFRTILRCCQATIN